MKKHGAKYVLIIVVLAVAGLYLWRSNTNNFTLPSELTAELGAAKNYKDTESKTAFTYPNKLKITETPIEGVEGGKTILAETGEAKKGFEMVVLPFDEAGPLTKERILQDIPDKVINNEKNVTVGKNIPALAFDSEDESIGPTYEIWFVSNGFIYQARTYPDFGVSMGEILKTFK
jgi:hypothetical protein